MSKPNPRRANGSKRNKVVARLRARHDPCAICGQPIDYNLPSRHPMSFEADEIVPVSKGGSPYDIHNLQAAHRICNERRGNKSMDELRSMSESKINPAKIANDLTLPLSRPW